MLLYNYVIVLLFSIDDNDLKAHTFWIQFDSNIIVIFLTQKSHDALVAQYTAIISENKSMERNLE